MRRLLITGLAVAALLAHASRCLAQMTSGEAANAGRAAGSSAVPTIRGGINSSNGQSLIPGYTNNPQEASYFGNGNGNVTVPTADRLLACENSTTADCVAVNLMRHRSSTANPVTINPLDPLVQANRSRARNPGGELGGMMASFPTAPTSNCVQPPPPGGSGETTEICASYVVPEDRTCVKNHILEIERWWQYTCEKSNAEVVRSTCERTLDVNVAWVSNCEVGTNLTSAGFGWGYDYRRGRDLYINGGVVRANCQPSLDTSVRLHMWGGDLTEGDYGSGPEYRPPPNTDLLPTQETIDVPTTISTLFRAPVSGIKFEPGSGCDAGGNCTYRGHRGPSRYACNPGETFMVEFCDYNGCGYNFPTTFDGDQVGVDVPATCVVNRGEPDPNTGECPSGSSRYGWACYASGSAPVYAGLGAGANGFTLSFRKPRFEPRETETVISTCSAQEADTTCRIASQTCVDGPSTRNINGVDVYRACWRTSYDYECIRMGGPDHCAPLTAEPLCAQNRVDTCTAYAFDGRTCLSFDAGYRCTRDMGPPPNVRLDDSGYVVRRDFLDESACSLHRNSPVCELQTSVCTDTADRVIDGLPFSRPCWSYTDTYTCAGSQTNECQPLIDRGCRFQSSVCREMLPDAQTCAMSDHYYTCGSVPPPPPPNTCDSSPYCINGICYDMSRPGDQDFGRTVAMMELARQAGSYIDQGNLRVFNGAPSTCRRRVFGLVNCCKSDAPTGGQDWTNAAYRTGFSFGRQYLGSSYVYDSIFFSDTPQWMTSGLESLGVLNAGGANSFSAYGITVGWDAGGFAVVGFDPWSFVISIAINFILSELMSCEDADKLTALKKAQGICHPLGSYCSTRSPFGCVTRTESYCCFNSKLAKAITVQGRQQLGLGMGTPQAPQCEGLTVDQLAALDFSRIDLTEFIQSITANAVSNSTATQNVIDAITRRTCPNGPPC